MIKDLNQLNMMHMDVLREIGNIGSGNAATALADMLQQKIELDVPIVRIQDINTATGFLGGPEQVLVGILSKLSGDIEGLMMFLIQKEFAQAIIKILLQQEHSALEQLSEMELSVIGEMGNILISSYITSLATLTDLKIKTSVPAISVDMVGALLCVPAVESSDISDEIIFIENDFLSDEDRITANMLLVPNMDSLNKIMQRLGIER